MIRRFATVLPLIAFANAAVATATEAPSAAADRTLDTVDVTGLQPGPTFWRVSRGDHELWVLGTVSPVPSRMTWDTREVDAVIAESQQVLLGPNVNIKADVGFFGKLALIPKLIGLRSNPGKAPLSSVLNPTDYAQWQKLAKRHFGRVRANDKRRPIFAAQALYDEALDDTGLKSDSGVTAHVSKAAKRASVPVVTAKITVEVTDMKGLLNAFNQSAIDDTVCLHQVMTHVDHDLPTMRERANAWAVGDIDALRRTDYTENYDTCLRSLFNAPSLTRFGFANLRERAQDAWLEAAETALKTNRSTFVVLSMGQLLRDDGYLAELRKRGYTVEAPGEDAVPEADTTTPP